MLFKKSEKNTAVLQSEMQEPLSFLEQYPQYLSQQNITKLTTDNPWIQKLLKNAYQKGFISLRK